MTEVHQRLERRENVAVTELRFEYGLIGRCTTIEVLLHGVSKDRELST